MQAVGLSIAEMRALVAPMAQVNGSLKPLFTELAQELSQEQIDEPTTANLSERVMSQITPNTLLSELHYLLVYTLFLRSHPNCAAFPPKPVVSILVTAMIKALPL